MPEPARVAVIGAGPKGTFALDALATALEHSSRRLRPHVHVFEPHPRPGAGPVYDPTQPGFLRLNYSNHMVNMWLCPTHGPRFVDWLARHHPEYADPSDSAPRALVGEYLASGYRSIIGRLSALATVTHHRRAVEAAELWQGEWHLRSSGPSDPVVADEVLITTGHSSRSALPTGLHGPNFFGSVYPVQVLEPIRSDSRVAIRGLGLTAIDATLALTEGRGGRFDDAWPVPTYVPSGREPRDILLYSRTGLTMTPKPLHPTAVDFGAETAELAQRLAGAVDPLRVLRRYVDGADPRPPGDRCRLTAGDRLLHDVRAAFTMRPVDHDGGRAGRWTGTYSAVVEAVVERRFDAQWADFANFAEEMERVAFGPPARNAARFASLVDAGVVDLSMAANPTVTRTDSGFSVCTPSAQTMVDTVVNAVLPGPGVGNKPSALLASLLSRGHLRRTSHGDGIDVTRDCGAVAADGHTTSGLSLIGRMTNGATFGNDTLSRTLHDYPERWAQSCAARLARR